MPKRDALMTGFDDAIPTPDISGTGLNGMGNDFDMGGGSAGLIASPWENKPVSTPSGQATDGKIPSGPKFVDVPGGEPSSPADITSTRNTIDRR